MIARSSFFIAGLFFLQAPVFAQSKLVKDLDGDLKGDTVYIDNSTIICRLSSQQYKKVSSKEIDALNEESGIGETKNGFEFWNNWMRAGYKNQFRYDGKTGKMQLIGMSRYEYGNVMNDGSGASSVNLLTGDYIGNWNYYDEKKDKLIEIPEIKVKMILPKISLEAFNDDAYFTYSDKCAALYEKHKKLMQHK